MESCYKHYEGCHLKGIPIGTPFRSKFFIPKSKQSRISKDVEIFILLRLNSICEGDGENMNPKYPNTAAGAVSQNIHSEKGSHLKHEAVNAIKGLTDVTGALQEETSITYDPKKSPNVCGLANNILSRHIEEKKNDISDIDVFDIHSINADDSLREMTSKLFGADILNVLNRLKVIDLGKKTNEKCNKEENKNQGKKRVCNSAEVSLKSPTKKIKVNDFLNDGDKTGNRKSLRLRSAGPRPDYNALEKGAAYFSEVEYEPAESDKETYDSDYELPDYELPSAKGAIAEKLVKLKDLEIDKTAANESGDYQTDSNVLENSLNEEIRSKSNKIKHSKSDKSSHKKMKKMKHKKEKDGHFSQQDFNGDGNKEIGDDVQNVDEVKVEDAEKKLLSVSDLDQNLMEEKPNTCIKNVKEKNTIKGNDSDESDPELVGLSVKEKSRVIRQRKKIQKESKRIKVKLQDHPDKYRMDLMDSFARKDRGKSRLECATEIFVCTVCEKFKAKSTDAMETHIESHVNGELHCNECPYIAPFINNLARHKREVHKRNVNICSECGVETNGLDGLKDHLGKVHGKPQYKCKFCLKEKDEHFAATTKNNYRQHIRQVHPEKMAACKTCSRLFANDTMLKRHMELGCAGDKPSYACEKCGKTYNSQDRVHDHVERVHNKVRRFQCPHCPFTAARGAGLNQHLHIHTGYHPFKCDQCTFTCVQKYQLTSHMRTHTGDKPYKCNQCNYAAAWNVQLKDHLKVHGMINTVLCDLCNVVFKDMRTFKTHQSKEHPIETHQVRQTMKMEAQPVRQTVETHQGVQTMEIHQVVQTMEAPSYMTM